MKKFKNLFEQSPAADYKVKKDEDAEVKDIKPRSSDEEKFKNMHKVEKKEHPVAPSEVHTGDRAKGKKSDAGQDHTGYEKAGEPVLKTYAQFAKMGGHGGDSYKGVGKSAGEKAPVMQGSSKIKEEVELVDEAFKAGKIQFKDGKYKVIDEKTAEILNNAMKELNTTNRKRMETEAKKDTQSFEAMLKFAKTVG